MELKLFWLLLCLFALVLAALALFVLVLLVTSGGWLVFVLLLFVFPAFVLEFLNSFGVFNASPRNVTSTTRFGDSLSQL